MTPTAHFLKRLMVEDEAASAVEYGLITAVIAVALIGALIAFRAEIVGMFDRAGKTIKGATS